MRNAEHAFRQAEHAHARAKAVYGRALALAHVKPRLDLEAAYLAAMAAEIRRARALKRMMTE